MRWLTIKVRIFLREEDGVTAIEYALIASLIALVIIGGVTVVGSTLLDIFNKVEAGFPD